MADSSDDDWNLLDEVVPLRSDNASGNDTEDEEDRDDEKPTLTDEEAQRRNVYLQELQQHKQQLETRLDALEKCFEERDQTSKYFTSILEDNVGSDDPIEATFENLKTIIDELHEDYDNTLSEISDVVETLESEGYNLREHESIEIASEKYTEEEQMKVDATTRRLNKERPVTIPKSDKSDTLENDDEVKLGRLRKKQKVHVTESIDILYSDDDGEEEEGVVAQKMRVFGTKTDFEGFETDTPKQVWKHKSIIGMLHLTSSQTTFLKPHQLDALNFAFKRFETHSANSTRGALIAHQMGLGKTLVGLLTAQAFHNFDSTGRILGIAPKNVLHNWQSELLSWDAITVPLNIIESSAEAKRSTQMWAHNGGILFLSYELFRSLVERGFKFPYYDLLILDEAHKLRNSATSITSAIMTQSPPFRMGLSGTPFSNSIKEYLTTVEAIEPGFLDSVGITVDESFEHRFMETIKKGDTKNASKEDITAMKQHISVLKDSLAPIIHHRDRSILKASLPEDTQTVLFYDLTPDAMQKYATLPSGLWVRQSALREISLSQKKTLVKNLITAALEEGRCPLVFSYSKEFLIQLHAEYQTDSFLINGDTPARERQELTEQFQSGKGKIGFISALAGSVGLNLVRATVVILSDPGWNPTVDNQAWARSWRLGQTNPVNVYRCVSNDTVETLQYRLQVSKYAMGCRVTDEQEIDRIFEETELKLHAANASIEFIPEEDIKDALLRRFMTKNKFSVQYSNHDDLFEDDKIQLTDAEANDAQNAVNKIMNTKYRYLKDSAGQEHRLCNSATHFPGGSQLTPPLIPIIQYQATHYEIILSPHQRIEMQCLNTDAAEGEPYSDWSKMAIISRKDWPSDNKETPFIAYTPKARLKEGLYRFRARAIQDDLTSEWSEASALLNIEG
jgi:SNF2 family DNA or RNA helicase